MKRHTLLILLKNLSAKTMVVCFILCIQLLSANAQNRSLEQMMATANDVLQKEVVASNGQKRIRPLKDLKILEEHDLYTLIGYQDGGFAIITHDSKQTPVLGYSDSRLDSSKVAPEFVYLLKQYDQMLEKASREGRVIKPLLAGKVNSKKEPLLKTVWAQYAPFNDLCPTMEGRPVVTGCVATALAQILYYHKCPSKLRGYKVYSYWDDNLINQKHIIRKNMSDVILEWDNMKDDYNNSYTATQGNAVAQLMYACGVAVNMMYSSGGIWSVGSSAYMSDIVDGVTNFFPGINAFENDVTSDNILSAIDKNLPLAFAGSDIKGLGHAFVVDGYNEDGYLHCNFGWGGVQDGYYLLTDMNGYPYYQQMIVIEPSADIRPEFKPSLELTGKILSVSGIPSASITSDTQWYCLFNISRNAIASTKSSKITASQYIPFCDQAIYVSPNVARFISLGNNKYYIQSGTGDYYSIIDGTLETSDSPYIFTVTTDGDDIFHIKDANSNNVRIDGFADEGWNLYAVSAENAPEVPISKLGFERTRFYMSEGEEKTLSIIATPSNANISSLKWISSNPYVVSVNESGVIKAISGGEAIIVAKAMDGNEGCAYCKIIVRASNIVFEDPDTKAYCLRRWDTDKNGELSTAEAANVATIDDDHSHIGTLKSFNEFRYFTGVKYMSDTFWDSYSWLESIQLPPSLKSIGIATFFNCNSLKNIEFPDGIEYIGEIAFMDNPYLETIKLPKSLSYISGNAFAGCKNLREFQIDESNPYYTCVDGVVYTKDMRTLVIAPKGKKVVNVPESVKEIGKLAFMDSYIEEINLPNGLEKIGLCSFSNTHRLRTIRIPAHTMIEMRSFDPCSSSSKDKKSMLESIDVDPTNPYYTSIDGVLFTKSVDKTQLIQYPSGKKNRYYKIPDICKSVYEKAYPFGGTSYLRVLDCGTAEAPLLAGMNIEELRLNNSVQDLIASNYIHTMVSTSTTPAPRPIHIEYSKTTLHVPAQAIDNYKNSDWNVCREIVAIKDVDIRYDKVYVTPGQQIPLIYYLSDGIKPLWESSDNNVVEVTSDGSVIGKNIGTSIVYLKSAQNQQVCDSCVVVVEKDFNINFEDKDIEAVAIDTWDQNEDGILQYSEALNVDKMYLGQFSRLGLKDKFNPELFYELKYFKNLNFIWGVFQMCQKLKEITIPENVKYIDYIFQNCTDDKIIHCLPIEPPFLNDNAVEALRNFTIFVPEESYQSYKNAQGWKDCPRLYPAGKSYGICDNILWYISSDNTLVVDGKSGYDDAGIKDYAIIPSDNTATNAPWAKYSNEITSINITGKIFYIGEYAFACLNNVRSVSIPSEVFEIANYSFFNCGSITEITCNSAEPPCIDENTFEGVDKQNCILWVSPQSIEAYEEDYYWNEFANIKPFKENAVIASGTCGKNLTWELSNEYVLTISGTGNMDDYRQSPQPWVNYKDRIKSIIITDGVTSIGGRAFVELWNVDSISMPNSILSIDQNAFYGCCMSSINLPKALTELSFGVFECCGDLRSITIPRYVSQIGYYSFSSCYELREIKCYAHKPPYVITDYSFKNVNKSQCKLYVPQGSLVAYRNAEGWKDFIILPLEEEENIFNPEGRWYLREVSTGLYASFGIGKKGTEVNLTSIPKPINICAGNYGYTIQFEGKIGWLTHNLGDSECVLDGDIVDYAFLEDEEGFTFSTQGKYLSYAWNYQYNINNLVWSTDKTVWQLEKCESDDDGINKVTTDNPEVPIYNLQGQRITGMQKGINIVGGKKILF